MTHQYQTLIIFSDFQNLPSLYLVDGHYAHLEGVVINNTDDPVLEKELQDLVYGDDGRIKLTAVDYVNDDMDVQTVICCGFAPSEKNWTWPGTRLATQLALERKANDISNDTTKY